MILSRLASARALKKVSSCSSLGGISVVIGYSFTLII
jgi:hypothetical protein